MSGYRVRIWWACTILSSLITSVGCGSSTSFTNGLEDGAIADDASGQQDSMVLGNGSVDGSGVTVDGSGTVPVPSGGTNFFIFDGGAFPDGSRILDDGAIVGPTGERIGTCVAGLTQCTNCRDDDGDGLYDWMDPECTGPLDNEEATYATGIPGDNVDLCKQDCFFDGNSGAGDDRCMWNLKCQPWSKFEQCAYDPQMAANEKQCPTPTKECVDFCQPLTPKGCDCFGCCDVYDRAGAVHSVMLAEQCSQANLGDATKCPVCTKSPACGQPCGECDFCLGKTSLPAKCYVPAPVPDAGTSTGGGDGGGAVVVDGHTGLGGDGGVTLPPVPGWSCQAGQSACDMNYPCSAGTYCLTGCCIEVLR